MLDNKQLTSLDRQLRYNHRWGPFVITTADKVGPEGSATRAEALYLLSQKVERYKEGHSKQVCDRVDIALSEEEPEFNC